LFPPGIRAASYLTKYILLIVMSLRFHAHWQVESGDLAKYGLIPEFIGRLPILVSLAALNEDQLVQVV
jgi:ATP-dependent protease Clp ATPase subunit